MKAIRYAVLLFLLILVPGCGSDKEKGMNRHQDMPRSAPPEEAK
jgi:hypothetical protein